MTGIILLTLFLPAGFSLRQSPDLSAYEGQNVTLQCTQIGSSYNGMYWFRQRPSESLEPIVFYYVNMGTLEDRFQQKVSAIRKDNSLDLTVKELQSTDSGIYFCAKQDSFADLKFGPGTRLTVLEPNMTITNPTVKLLPPSPDELCYAQKNREKVTLVCLATDFYPDHVSITWQVNGKEKKNNVATDHVAQQANSTSLYSMSSRLRVDQIEWTNIKNNFTCIVTFYNGHDYLMFQSNIKFSPAKIPPRVYNTVQFGYLMFLSKSLLYAVFVSVMVWKCKATKEKTLMTENGDIMIS